MEAKFTRHDCKDPKGHLLFYIEVAEYFYLEYIVWTSIPLSVINTKEIINYIRIIEERVMSNDLRENFIEKLFKEIKEISGIEKYYLFSLS
ncbi:MAG: hypothetical protein IPP38_12335 [Bacteroidetes bacterium]|nr:hypothetical protein [Bacteroidota bacterium]